MKDGIVFYFVDLIGDICVIKLVWILIFVLFGIVNFSRSCVDV